MNMARNLQMIASATLGLAISTSCTLAQGNSQGMGMGMGPGGQPPGQARDYDNLRPGDLPYRMGDLERRLLRDYYGQQTNCPPGLAKKNNGCLPPGIAKKRYAIGQRLPAGVIVSDLPFGFREQLPPLPGGYEYRFLDGDLGILELSTLIVFDAIGVI